MRANIPEDFAERYEAFFQADSDASEYWNDPEFIELSKRISGKTVDLVFINGDAFEKEDNNIWIPDCCYELEDKG